jgi:tetratricopeptide (TPR) repeat protein
MFWKKPYDRNVALAKAEKARARGSVRTAVKWLRKVLEHTPDDLAVRAKLAPLLARQGRHDEARQNFDMAADGFMAAGFSPKAVAVWMLAARTYPEHTIYIERIATELTQRGCRKDAVLALLDGRNRLQKRRHRPSAIHLLRQVVSLDSTHLNATLDLVDLLRREGATEEPRRLLTRILATAASTAQRRRVRFAQFRLEPTWRGAIDWAFAR